MAVATADPAARLEAAAASVAQELPASFRKDLEAYLSWASGADRLADDAPTTPLKASTLRQRREHLRLAASTLALCLGSPDQVEHLATLVAPANMRAILSRYLAATADNQPTTFIRGLAITLLAVARHWIKVPPEQMEELKRLNAKLGSTPTGLTQKNQDLVRRFQDRELLTALLDLPDTLRKQANSGRSSPARRLQKMQIALAIEILLAAPMRMQNLATLELGRSLQWPSGRNGPAYVVLRRDETKNEVPLEYPLPDHCLELLREYLDRFRSYATVTDREWLFLRLDGSRVPDSALRDGITKAVARELGHRDDTAPIPPRRGRRRPRRPPRRPRTGARSAGAPQHQDHVQFLRGDAHARSRPRIRSHPRT